VANQIDWEMAETAQWALPCLQLQWVSKLKANFLLYGKTCNTGSLDYRHNVPDSQDKQHFFKHPLETVIHYWNKALEELGQWLQAAQTHPKLRQDLAEGLHR